MNVAFSIGIFLQAPRQATGDVPALGLLQRDSAAREPRRPPAVPLLGHAGRLPVRRRRLRVPGALQVDEQAPERVQVQERR